MDGHRFVCPDCLNAVFLLIRTAYALACATLIDLMCGEIVCAMSHARDLMLVWRHIVDFSIGREIRV